MEEADRDWMVGGWMFLNWYWLTPVVPDKGP